MIAIFTEAGHSVGLGHLTRMRSLKNQLNDDGYEACMFVHTEDESLVQAERQEKRKLWINDIDAVRSEINRSDFVVVDTYSTSEAFMKDLSCACGKLIAIDDYNRIRYEGCAVINPNYYGSSVDYPSGIDAEYYAGSEYTLLRPEFHVLRERSVRECVQRILITFGGTDIMDLTPKTVEYCHEIIPGAKLDVVITSSFKNVDKIKKTLNANDVLHCNVDAVCMNRLMNQADFAIASAGSTSNELMKVQCPSILIKVADNQAKNIEYLEPLGYFRTFDTGTFEKIKEMLKPDVRRTILNELMKLETKSTAKLLIEQLYDKHVCKTI